MGYDIVEVSDDAHPLLSDASARLVIAVPLGALRALDHRGGEFPPRSGRVSECTAEDDEQDELQRGRVEKIPRKGPAVREEDHHGRDCDRDQSDAASASIDGGVAADRCGEERAR